MAASSEIKRLLAKAAKKAKAKKSKSKKSNGISDDIRNSSIITAIFLLLMNFASTLISSSSGGTLFHTLDFVPLVALFDADFTGDEMTKTAADDVIKLRYDVMETEMETIVLSYVNAKYGCGASSIDSSGHIKSGERCDIDAKLTSFYSGRTVKYAIPTSSVPD